MKRMSGLTLQWHNLAPIDIHLDHQIDIHPDRRRHEVNNVRVIADTGHVQRHPQYLAMLQTDAIRIQISKIKSVEIELLKVNHASKPNVAAIQIGKALLKAHREILNAAAKSKLREELK